MTSELQFRPQLQEQHQEGEGAATGAPAAAPNEAAAGNHNAAPTAQQALSDDDKIIEDLRREHFAKKGNTEDPVKTKDKKNTKKVDEKSTAIVKYGTPEDAISAITKAVEAGDDKALARALGKPESFLETSEAKWKVFREQQNAVRERERTVKQREHTFSENYAAAKKELGPILLAQKAYADGKYDQFVTLIQEITGESYDEAQRKVIKGEIALDPETKRTRAELKALRDELAAEKKKQQEQGSKENQQAQLAKAMDAVGEELAGHRVAKVKGFQRMVLDRVRDSWDANEETYTMGFEEAADAIMSDKDAEAESLGYRRAQEERAAKPKAEDKPQLPPRARSADARSPDGEEWEKRDMTDEEIMASIHRDVKSGRIKV